MTTPRTTDPAVPLLLLLSATTGLVDAVSVLGLGKVFTANMTGNVVFLGFALAGVPGFSWPLYVVALAFFSLGALGGGRLGRMHERLGRRRWLLRAAAAEAAFLWLAAAVAFQGMVPTYGATCAMIALTAIAMGLRNATVRQMKVPDLTTTVLTLTVTGIAADSPIGGGDNPNIGRRVAAVTTILLGAIAGALLIVRFGLGVPLGLAGIAVLLATLLLARDVPREG